MFLETKGYVPDKEIKRQREKRLEDEYQVTDRTYDEYSQEYDFDKEMHEWPDNAVIVNMGSGVYKNFERGLYDKIKSLGKMLILLR